MKSLLTFLSLFVVITLCGCRHGVNPNGPVAPMTLLTPQTKVPPPATGSYSIPGGYYQGQASNSPPSGNSSPTTFASVSDQPIGSGVANSGVAQVAAAPPSQPVNLPAWTDYSPRYSEVQPAAFNSSVPSVSSGPTTSQQRSPADSGLRPQLRGMEVVDLTRADKPPTTAGPSIPSEPSQDSELLPATRTNSSSLPWRDPIQ